MDFTHLLSRVYFASTLRLIHGFRASLVHRIIARTLTQEFVRIVSPGDFHGYQDAN